MTTYAELRSWIIAELQSAGIDAAEARTEAEMIIEDVTGWKITEQILHDTDAPGEQLLRVVATIIEQRKERRPLQYCLGYSYFMGMKLAVRPRVLIPRSDTETLVQVALQRMDDVRALFLADIGIGSGAVALAILKQRPHATVSGIDISADAIALSRQNAISENVFDRLHLLHGDWEALLPKQLDGIVSNPPYIPLSDRATLPPEVADYEPPEALFGGGEDGLEFYRKLSRNAPAHLSDGGFAAVEIGDKQADAVSTIFQTAGWLDVRLEHDVNGLPRVISALRPPGVSS